MSSEIPLPPRCAARFRLEGKLGKGGAGMVYRALQVDLERPVAIKVLHREVLAEAALVERFKVEARITAQLTHPAIVRILDHDVEDGIPWIAYELLPGPTLRQHLAPGPLPWKEALAIAMQIAGALDVAHQAGVLHRDVKPDNVLGAGPGRWKVTDFGIAKFAGSGLETTQTGLLMGTPAYLAPEHIASGYAEPASDLYALGITLFEMLTAKRPFSDSNPVRLLEKHLAADPPAPSTMAPDIPPEIDALVLRTLAKTPAERWPDAGTLRRAIIDLLGPDASIDIQKVDVAKQLAAIPNRFNPNVSLGHLPPQKLAGSTAPAALPSPVDDDAAPTRPSNRPPPRTSDAPPVPKPPGAQPLPASSPAPLVAGGLVLLILGALLLPRGPAVAPRPPPSPGASAAPAGSHLPAWELQQMHAALADVIAKREERNPRVKELASYLIPPFPNVSKAREIAESLMKDEAVATAATQKLADRMAEVYPTPDLVPDAEIVLYARIFVNRTRAWCWSENTRITLEHCEQAERTAPGPVGQTPALDAMTRAPYPPGLVVPLFAALDALGAALKRLAANPRAIDAELGDLLLEENYMAVNVAWREMSDSVYRRVSPRVMALRATCAQLREPVGPGLGRVAMAVWDMGMAPTGELKFSRERLVSALKELGALAVETPGLAPVRDAIAHTLISPAR